MKTASKTLVVVILAILITASMAVAGRRAAEGDRLSYRAAGNSLVIRLNQHYLKANSTYVLCLASGPGKPGNELLKQFSVCGEEGYYDFTSLSTDANGRLAYNSAVELPAGKYDAAFLLKDVGDGYKCVLVKNDLRFMITDDGIRYHSDRGLLSIKLNLKDLKANSTYVLCLASAPDKPGNEQLKQFGIWGDEGYYDFASLSTDANGRLVYNGSVRLPVGNYNATFLLKDVSDSFKCVLVKNDLRFTIAEDRSQFDQYRYLGAYTELVD